MTAPGQGARFRVLLPAMDDPDFDDPSDDPEESSDESAEILATGFRGNSEVR